MSSIPATIGITSEHARRLVNRARSFYGDRTHVRSAERLIEAGIARLEERGELTTPAPNGSSDTPAAPEEAAA